MKLSFTETGWGDYFYWQTGDKKTLKQINKLLADIEHYGFDGIEKPEPLRGYLSNVIKIIRYKITLSQLYHKSKIG